MFNKKILKIALMLLVLIAVFHLLTKKNPNFQRPEHIEGLKCDRRIPHEREDFWDGNRMKENMWGGEKKKENLWGGRNQKKKR